MKPLRWLVGGFSLRALNLGLLLVLLVLLVLYGLVGISFYSGRPFSNQYYTFNRNRTSDPWFVILIAFVSGVELLVLTGIYGALKRSLTYFKAYISGLLGLFAVAFILFTQLLILQQPEVLYFDVNGHTFECLANNTAVLADDESVLAVGTPADEDLTAECASLRTFHLVLLGLAGFVLPIVGGCPCLAAALRYAHELARERKEFSIELTTAPYGGNPPTERIIQ